MNIFLFTGILLFLAIYSGRFFHKIKLPIVTGYILIGFILGNVPIFHTLNPLFAKTTLFIDEFALAVISFEMGTEFSLKKLRKIEKKVVIITIIQAIFTWVIIFLGLKFFLHIPAAVSIVIASIGIATAPDIIILVTREYNPKGILSEYLKGIVTLDDLITEIMFFISIPVAQSIMQFHYLQSSYAFIIVKEIVFSVALGIGLGILFTYVASEFRGLRVLFAVTIGFIFVVIGMSLLLKLHIILIAILTGITFTNLSREKRIIHEVLSQIDAPLFIIFLIVNGSALSVKLIYESHFLGIALILTRGFGKVFGGFLGSSITNLKYRRNAIGWGLLPQSEISIYLAVLARNALPYYGNTIFVAIMTGVIFFEIIGAPILKGILTEKV